MGIRASLKGRGDDLINGRAGIRELFLVRSLARGERRVFSFSSVCCVARGRTTCMREVLRKRSSLFLLVSLPTGEAIAAEIYSE